MTNLLSEHDLWGTGGNTVVALPPSRDDLFVLVTIEGKVALNWPITEFNKAVRIAEAFARRSRPASPVTIKVLCLSCAEVQAMGFVAGDLFANETPEEEAEMRQACLQNCFAMLRESSDAAVRADALEILSELGAMQ